MPTSSKHNPRGSCWPVPHLHKHMVLFLDKLISGLDKFNLAEWADSSQLLLKLPCHTPSLPKFHPAFDVAERTQTSKAGGPEREFQLASHEPSRMATGVSLHALSLRRLSHNLGGHSTLSGHGGDHRWHTVGARQTVTIILRKT